MNHRHVPPSLAFLPALFAAALAAQDTVAVPAPANGSSCAFVQHLKQEQAIDAGGQQMEFKAEVVHDFVLTISEGKDAGSRHVQGTMVRIHGNYDIAGMGGLDFDTDKASNANKAGGKADGKPEEKAEGKADADGDDDGEGPGAFGLPSGKALRAALAEVAGKTFTATVNGKGEVVECGGFGDAAAAARKKIGEGAQFLDGLIGERLLSSLVRGAMGYRPEGPVAVGAKWSTKEETGNSIVMDRAIEAHVAGFDADKVEIAMAGTITGRPDSKDTKIEDGKCSGTTTVSRVDGFAAHSDSKATFTIVTQHPMAGEITIDMTMTTKVERSAAGGEPAKPAPAGNGK